jgi:hypothetical protein
MSEKFSNNPFAETLKNFKPEQISKPEHVPTSGEVMLLFEILVKEKKYETRRKLEDEQGLYLWEIKIPQEDGGSVEYSYIRKGDYKARGLAGGSASETAIHVTYFDEDGIPTSGQSVLKLIDDKWIETP